MNVVPDIDKEFILERLSQEEIFERYLGIEIDFTELVKSPLREDSNPTCTFKRLAGGVVVFKDWSGHFSGNCFDVVVYLYECNFWDACRRIAYDFGLVDKLGFEGKKRKPIVKIYEERDSATVIQVKWRAFNNLDLSYWADHCIERETMVRYCTAPVQHAWVNGKMCYSARDEDPCYGYYFAGEYKLYFPLRTEYRFLGNYKGLQGYEQLPEKGKLVVVTKSLKDVMFLFQIGIAAVAPPSESSILTKDQYKDLSSRFMTVVSLYDFDLTGIRSANKMKRVFGIPRVFFTNGRFGTVDYDGKDVTDIARKHGCDHADRVINELLCQVL